MRLSLKNPYCPNFVLIHHKFRMVYDHHCPSSSYALHSTWVINFWRPGWAARCAYTAAFVPVSGHAQGGFLWKSWDEPDDEPCEIHGFIIIFPRNLPIYQQFNIAIDNSPFINMILFRLIYVLKMVLFQFATLPEGEMLPIKQRHRFRMMFWGQRDNGTTGGDSSGSGYGCHRNLHWTSPTRHEFENSGAFWEAQSR